MKTSWYVVHTQPNAETKAAMHLARQGFTVYLPCYLKRRRHARKIDQVSAPLFPRYMFVSVDITAQRWRSIRSTIGVSELVCNGDMPALVPVQVIATIKGREDAAGFIRMDNKLSFRPGDPVRLMDSAFCDSLALFDGASEHDRVTVLLDLLGRKVRVRIDADSVAAA